MIGDKSTPSQPEVEDVLDESDLEALPVPAIPAIPAPPPRRVPPQRSAIPPVPAVAQLVAPVRGSAREIDRASNVPAIDKAIEADQPSNVPAIDDSIDIPIEAASDPEPAPIESPDAPSFESRTDVVSLHGLVHARSSESEGWDDPEAPAEAVPEPSRTAPPPAAAVERGSSAPPPDAIVERGSTIPRPAAAVERSRTAPSLDAAVEQPKIAPQPKAAPEHSTSGSPPEPTIAALAPAEAGHAAPSLAAPEIAPVSDGAIDELSLLEANAIAAALPTRAALLHAYRARLAADVHGDFAAAATSCARAVQLAPDARFVMGTRRWIAERRGQPAEILAAVRGELQVAGEPAERAMLLWQIAGIEHHVLRQPDRARTALLNILEIEPNDLAARVAVGAIEHRHGTPAAAAEAWEQVATGIADPVARATYLAAAAGVREAALDDSDGARLVLERARELDPDHPGVQAGLESIYVRTRSWAEYARVLVAEAERVGEVDPVLGYHERAGDIYWECLGDSVAAARCYERAASLAPNDVVPLGKLAALYEQQAAYPELARTYERLLGCLLDPVRSAGVLFRLGTICETRLERTDDAIDLYRRALDANPTLASAAQALARLYHARQRWSDLAALLMIEADRASDPVQRAARYVAIAELLEAQLGTSPETIGLYERAIALDPAQTAALDALDRTYRASGRWEQLAALHEQQLIHATHPSCARALRLVLAAVYSDRLGAPDRAATHLRAVLDVDPDHFHTLVALARASADEGKWAEHVAVLEQQANLLGDGPEVVATLYRIATVVEHRLGDPAGAIEAYHRVLAHAPRHELALHAVLRLALSQSRWDDAIAIQRQLVGIASRPEEAAAILDHVGHLLEDKLGQPDEAIAAYEDALAVSPSFRPARIALERLLRKRSQFSRLAALLEQQAAGALGEVDRARLLCQAAVVHELHPEHSDSPDQAARLYEQALAVNQTLALPMWGMLRIAIQRSAWSDVAEMLGLLLCTATHPRSKARILVQLARVAELGARDGARAAALLDDAIAELGEGVVHFRTYLALAATDDENAWLERAARSTSDPRFTAALLRLRAARVEHGNDVRASAAAYQLALEHGDHPQLLDGLTRVLATSRGETFAETLSVRARQLHDGASRALLLTVAGAIEEAAQRAVKAEVAYSEAIAAQPDFQPALAGRQRLAALAGEWRDAAIAYAELAAACHEPRSKVALYEEAARLFDAQVHDPHSAVEHYRRALEIEPGRSTSLTGMLAIFEAAGAWDRAAAVIGEQVGTVADDDLRVRLLVSRALMVAERIGDREAAIADLQRALAIRPGNSEVLLILADLYETQRRWADASLALEQLAGAASNDEVRKLALIRDARIWTQEVPDYARALRILDDAAGLDPGDRTVAVQLAEVACLAGELGRGAELYEPLTRTGTAAERASALVALSTLRRQLGGDDDPIGAAFELLEEDPGVVAMLDAHFRRSGELAKFVELGEACLPRLHATEGAFALRLAIARALAHDLGTPDRARPHLHQAAHIAPTSPRPHLALGWMLAVADEHAAIDALRRAIELDPTEPEAYRALATICAKQGANGPATLLSTAVALLTGEPHDPVAGRDLLPSSLPPHEALALLVGSTRAGVVRQVVAALDPYLDVLFPEQIDRVARLPPLPGSHPMAHVVRNVAEALSYPPPTLYQSDQREPMLVASDPRSLAIPGSATVDAETMARLRFSTAWLIAHAAGGSTLFDLVPRDTAQALLRAATDPTADEQEHRELRRRLGTLPRRGRKELERIVESVGPIDAAAWMAWDHEERLRGVAIGLVVAGDLRAVAATMSLVPTASTVEQRRHRLGANPVVVEALRFAASERCWALQRCVYQPAGAAR